MYLLRGVAYVAFAWIAVTPSLSCAQQACEDLKKLNLVHVTITSAASVGAGPLKQPVGAPSKLPEVIVPRHCEVAGVARPTSDSEINFLLWLPPASVWNGKYMQRDRKSTRLNSSHLGISYAVFCLKKK